MKTSFLKNKKAQITIFIIIGIIILFSSAAFFYIKQKITSDDLSKKPLLNFKTSTNIKSIDNYLDQLFEQSFEQALYLSALNGGRLYSQNYCFRSVDHKISYFEFYGYDTIPTLNTTSDEILQFIKEDVYKKLEDGNFDIMGYSINLSDNLSGNVIFGNKDTSALIYWDIILISDDNKLIRKNDKFYVKSNLQYLKLFQLASLISNSGDNIFPSYLNSYENDNITLNIIPYGDEDIIYTLTDKSVSPPLIFMFATKNVIKLNPKIEFIPNFDLTVGDNFVYYVNAKDQDDNILFYESNDTNFPISLETGIINFTAKKEGNFSVLITVSNSFGGKSTETINFDITKSLNNNFFNSISSKIYILKNQSLNYSLKPFVNYNIMNNCTSSNPYLKLDHACNLLYAARPLTSINIINSTIFFNDKLGYKSTINISVIRI